MVAVKRVLYGGKQGFRRVSLSLERSGGVLTPRTDRLQEGQVGVRHIARCLVTRAGLLILPILEELVGKGRGFLRGGSLTSALRFGRRIGEGYVRGGDANQPPDADRTE